eukprot:8852377-Pyramimonas_sp.AAC.1
MVGINVGALEQFAPKLGQFIASGPRAGFFRQRDARGSARRRARRQFHNLVQNMGGLQSMEGAARISRARRIACGRARGGV